MLTADVDPSAHVSVVRPVLRHFDSLGCHGIRPIHNQICGWLARVMDVSVVKVQSCVSLRTV